MVRVRHRPAREGRSGKLTGDPAVHAGAVALIHGWDPLHYLGLAPDDARLAQAILNKATEMTGEHDKAMADYVAAKTAHHTVTGFAKTMSRFMRWLAKNR